MNVTETHMKGCFILEPKLFEDPRGYFFESFNQKAFEAKTGHVTSFVQDNQSLSHYGVMRGFHFQSGKSAQAKLVRCLQGEVLDVAVDIRPGSPTYGQHIAIRLSDTNMKQLFIPRGFAHAFIVLSAFAVFYYKCDNYYDPSSEGGILYSDPSLGVDWVVPADKIITSEKDLKYKPLSQMGPLSFH